MSDEFVKDWLAGNELPHLIEVFIEEEIDREAFTCLDSTIIATVIKKAGPRAKFWDKWTHWKKSLERVAVIPSTPLSTGVMTLQQASSSTVDMSAIEDGLVQDLLREVVTGDHNPLSLMPSTSSNADQHNVHRMSEASSIQGPLPTIQLITYSSVPPKINIRESLKIQKAQYIIEEYTSTGTLSTKRRCDLVRRAVSMLIEMTKTCYMDETSKEYLAQSIVEEFPNLADVQSKSNGGTGYEHFWIPNGGFITDRLKTVRRSLTASEKKYRKRRLFTMPESSENTEGTAELTDDVNDEVVRYMQHANPITNKDQIIEHHRSSSKLRRKWIADQSPSPADILDKYPRYADVDELIDIDFRTIHEEATELLLRKFPKVLANVSGQAGVTHNKQFDRQQALAGLRSLINALPAPNCRKSKKRRTSALTSEHFLFELQPATTNVEEYAKQESDRKQPFLLFLTDESGEITQTFIIADFRAIVANRDILQSIDKLFKMFYVFNIEYPHELKNFFLFIQTAIYNIDAGKMSSSIRDLKVRLGV